MVLLSTLEVCLNKTKKAQEIALLSKQFDLAKAVFLVCFKGMSVEQMTTLRKSLGPLNARLKVVRNTLAQLASDQHPHTKEALKGQFKGDNALIFVSDEVGGLAKFLKEFSQDVKFLQLRVAVLEGQFLDKSKILYLANLPSKKELQAKLLGVLQAPAQKFVSQLSAPLTELLQVMVAYKDKK